MSTSRSTFICCYFYCELKGGWFDEWCPVGWEFSGYFQIGTWIGCVLLFFLLLQGENLKFVIIWKLSKIITWEMGCKHRWSQAIENSDVLETLNLGMKLWVIIREILPVLTCTSKMWPQTRMILFHWNNENPSRISFTWGHFRGVRKTSNCFK